MKLRLVSKVLVGGWVLAAATSGASGAEPQSPTPQTSESSSQQRAKIREDLRRGIADNHYGVADALQLDASTFDKLMELLVDQQLEQSEYFHLLFAGKVPDKPMERMRGEAERVTRQVDAMRELLGQEKLERYQQLRFSLGHRRQIRELDERLGAADRLSSPQRERLVVLLNEHDVDSMEQRHMRSTQRWPFDGTLPESPSWEEMQRNSELQTITLNEEIWREMPESNRRLREKAAAFLTKPQLAMLAQVHAEQAATRKQDIERMRVEAGLSPTIPDQPAVVETMPATVERDVKLSLQASVNKEQPRYLTIVVSSGKSASLKIADGLFLEATPIVFADDAYNLRVQFFEMGVTGKRLIGSMDQSGKVPQASGDKSSRPVGGGGGRVLTGSKGYAVDLSTLVEAT